MRKVPQVIAPYTNDRRTQRVGATWTLRAFTNSYEVQIPVTMEDKIRGISSQAAPLEVSSLGSTKNDTKLKFYAVV